MLPTLHSYLLLSSWHVAIIQVGWGILGSALSSVSVNGSGNKVFGPVEDCAIVQPPPPGHIALHTVDFLSAFISDPYVFGRITTNHCLSVSALTPCLVQVLLMNGPAYL